jgi:hypothetical protein
MVPFLRTILISIFRKNTWNKRDHKCFVQQWMTKTVTKIFTVQITSRSRVFHSYGDITIAVEGLQNLGQCSALRAFKQVGRGLYCATPVDTRSLSFSVYHHPNLRTAPFSRHERGCWGPNLMGHQFSRLVIHARRCWGTILIHIITGLKAFKFQRIFLNSCL